MPLVRRSISFRLRISSYMKGKEASSLISTFFARGVAAAGSLILLVVLGRLYGVAGAGAFVLAQSLLMAASTIARYGMNNALIRFVGREHQSPVILTYLRWACTRATVYSLVLGGSIYLGRDILAEVFNTQGLGPLLSVTIFSLPAITLAMLLAGFLKGVRKPAAACLLENGSVPFVAAILTIALAWLLPEAGIIGAGFAFSIAAWAVLIQGLWQVRAWRSASDLFISSKTAANFDSAAFSRSSREFFIISLTTMMQTAGVVIIAGFFLSSSELGLFRTAQQLALLVSFILFVINAIYPPRFAALFYQGQNRELEKLAQRSASLGFFLSLPIALLCLVIPEVTLAIFGSGFSSAATMLRIIVIAQLVNVGTGSVVLLLAMTGHEALMRSISLICTVTALLLLCVLTPLFGPVGAAWALAALLITQKLVTIIYVWRRLGVWSAPFPNFLRYIGLHPYSKII